MTLGQMRLSTFGGLKPLCAHARAKLNTPEPKTIGPA